MRVLVTGGDGQLGTELCLLLRERADEAIAPDLEELDFLRADTIAAQIDRHRPDWVINCAAYTQVDKAEEEEDKAFRINRDGAREVARAARAAGAGLAHISTDFIFGGERCRPYREDDAANPLGVYGQSKWEGEQAVREEMPDALVLRTAWVYGVHGANFVRTMLRLAGEREELRVVADQVGTPSWTRDIGQALLRLIDLQESGTFHFTDEGVASWYDFACAIVEEARALGYDLKTRQVTPIATEDYPTPATRPAWSVLDKAKVRPLLETPIPHWRDSLRAMLRELKS